MAENHDYQALKWVKGEIQETLKQAQQSLEAFVENPEDSSLMRFCVNHLHQVYGTLQMVEFYGAALLAEEMENLAKSLTHQQVSKPDEAQQVLMQAMIQLPVYLDRLSEGEQDLPVVILPLLNDLRAARSESLLSETALFKPDLHAGDEAAPASEVADDLVQRLPELLKKIRQLYQFALMGVNRGDDLPTNLGYLAKSLAKLEKVYSGAPLAKLWWVASALVEGISQSAIELSASVKMLLEALDQQLKVTIDEHRQRDEPCPAELLKNLLYYVANADSSAPRVVAVQQAFHLDSALPSQDVIDQERQRLAGPDRKAVTSVVAALQEEFTKVKESMDLFLRTEPREFDVLKTMPPRLKQIADTLGILGIGQSRQVVLEQLDRIDEMVAANTMPDDDSLMDVAGGLLYVEATLQGMAAEDHAEPAADQTVAPQQLATATQALISESRAGLEGAKDAIMEFISSGFNTQALTEAPQLLDSVRGGLMMVPMTLPANILQSCHDYIQQQLIAAAAKPDQVALEALADAITSVEYYLECLEGQPDTDEAILEIAAEAVANLGYPVAQQERVSESAESRENQDAVCLDEADVDDTHWQENYITETFTADDSQALNSDDSLESLVASDLDDGSDSSVLEAPPTEVGELDADDEDDLIDDELIEIFVEESEEVLETINEHLPIWRHDPENAEALTELRRAYHTLKGSGRMVGASVVGELAWAVENMLNRVIDHSIGTTQPVVQIVSRVTEIIPNLVGHFKHKTQPDIDVDAYARIAEALSRGERLDVAASLAAAQEMADGTAAQPEAVVDDSTQEVAADIVPAALPDGYDPVLMEIFQQEAQSHLDVVSDFLASEASVFSNALLRALHTLKGSAHMAGIEPIAELATPTEKFIKECHTQGIAPDAEIRSLLADALALITKGAAQVQSRPEDAIEGADALLARIHDLEQQHLVTVDQPVADEDKPDPQLVAKFLADCTDMILDAADVLNEWQRDPVPGQRLDSLSKDVRVLGHGALEARLVDIASLCKALEETYSAAADKLITPDDGFFAVLHRAHEKLINMLDRVAIGQMPLPAEDSIEELAALLDRAIPVEPATGTSTAEPALESFSLPNMDTSDNDEVNGDASLAMAQDPELVEIFLEEANDILVTISNLLDDWLQAPEELDKVAELQRELHTLKGGARMAEVNQIADLAHCLEDLYEGLCQKRFTAVEPLFELLHQCHDALADMVEQIQNIQPVQPAAGLIASIDNFMKTGALPDQDAAPERPTFAETSESEDSAAVIEPEPMPVPEPAAFTLDMPVTAAPQATATDDGDVDPEILEIFTEEAEELTEGLDHCIHEWLNDRDNHDHLDEMKRLLHTLKGGARLAGLTHIGDQSHAFESFLIKTEADGIPLDDAFFAKVQSDYDALLVNIQSITSGTMAPEEIADLAARATAAAQEKAEEAASFALAQVGAAEQPVAEKAEPARPAAESVRVTSELLEELINLAGETSIIRGRMETELVDFSFVIDEIGQTVDRVRELLRRLDLETEAQILYRHQKDKEEQGHDYEDFDPLEMDRYSTLNQLSRSLGESASDLIDLTDSLRDRSRDTETLLLQQARVNTELQEGLMRTRMVPFSRTVPRLRRIIRQISQETDKKAELEVIGAEGEMDRNVLERLVAPLEHMLRNAVDHGIETPQERVAKGKKETGRITLHLAREGGEVVLRLSDDGKGINMERVKARAVERGLMKPNAPLSDKEIMQFVFRAGFSTAEKVTQISGRGVGMDVVHSEIKQLGGALKIHSAQDAGSQFTIRLPFTVSVNRALMVRVADDAYAIPLNNIEGIVRVSPYELEAYYQPDAPDFEYAGSKYRMRYLGGFVHGSNIPNLQGHTRPLPVLLVRGAEHTMALQVDSLIGSREIVVKSVGPQLSAVSGISGATILGDGSVVIILDLMAMIRAEQAQLTVDSLPSPIPEENEPEDRTPVVMVVDDSVTVRKVTSRLLERNGYDVLTAKDGVDAITQLQETKPDCMLLDIEMPRMDGFEVATLVRHDSRLQDVPIIMITSRTGEKHKERALSIGVNEYMGKPFQETALLENIKALLTRQKVL